MTREQLEHLIRASGVITNQYEFVILGSQSILGAIPNPPALFTMSAEADIYPLQAPALADEIELTKTALLKHLEHGVLLVNLAALYPDFSSRLSLADLQTIVHFPDIYPSSAAVPLARTVQRIDDAGKAADWFPRAPSDGQPVTPPKT